MTNLELTEDDLEVAEASVGFAIENCPVEGVLSSEDGNPISFDALQTLVEMLRKARGQSAAGPALRDDSLEQLKVVINYTSENCPVEGVATFHDGRPISGKDIMMLAEKLK